MLDLVLKTHLLTLFNFGHLKYVRHSTNVTVNKTGIVSVFPESTIYQERQTDL